MFADKSRLVSSWGRCRCEAQRARMADKSSRETSARLAYQERAVLAQCFEMVTGQSVDRLVCFRSRNSPRPTRGLLLASVPSRFDLDRCSFTRTFLASPVKGSEWGFPSTIRRCCLPSTQRRLLPGVLHSAVPVCPSRKDTLHRCTALHPHWRRIPPACTPAAP